MEKLEKNQKRTTENGAVGYATSGHKLVDLNFAIPSFRNGIDGYLFEEALGEDERLTLKWLLYLRDIRQGVGERKSFRDFVIYLTALNRKLANKFLSIVPIEEYGRWDDYIEIMDYCSFDVVSHKIVSQWQLDNKNMAEGKPISLLSKWLPSENASSESTKEKARSVRKMLGLDAKSYRKALSKMRKYIDVVERKMSANEWEDIDYCTVPSRANLIYAQAFFKHDEERRYEYLKSLKNGEAKINANALFLHDIVHKYMDSYYYYDIDKHSYDETLEQLWKAQKKVEGFSDTVVVRDGSGSMMYSIGNTKVSALDVADAITLYCAENNEGEFKNKFITFSSEPKVIDVSAKKTLKDKLVRLRKEDDCENTNIEKVFDLILDTALKNHISDGELPKSILIISDMEFDEIRTGKDDVLFESIEKKYASCGYRLPKLIFWNVNSRMNVVPITQNKNGVILLSGFSKNLMSMVMSSELDPYKALVKELEKPRYSIIDALYE